MSRSPERNGRRRSRSASRSVSPSGDRHRGSKHHRSTYSRSPEPERTKRLHIANIDESIHRRHIEEVFGRFGKLADVWVASYPPFYAFVVYETADDAASALKEMKSGYIKDCHIRTSIALPRNSGNRRGPPPRRYGGGGGGGGGGRRSPYGRRSRSPYRSRVRSRSRSPRRHRRNSADSR